MKSTILILIVSLHLTANASFAKIGESEARVDDLYGKPVGKWDDYLGYKKLYHWRGFNVMVTFFNGVSQREMFDKAGLTHRAEKSLGKYAGVGKNGVIYDVNTGAYTTQSFEDKYLAARTAAWAKEEQKR